MCKWIKFILLQSLCYDSTWPKVSPRGPLMCKVFSGDITSWSGNGPMFGLLLKQRWLAISRRGRCVRLFSAPPIATNIGSHVPMGVAIWAVEQAILCLSADSALDRLSVPALALRGGTRYRTVTSPNHHHHHLLEFTHDIKYHSGPYRYSRI